MYSIITIGRQHGSGGARIGRELAARLGVSFYDKDSLREHALEQGWERTLNDSFDERNARSLLLSLSTGAYSFGYYDPEHSNAISQKAYQVAFETIKEVARAGPCVIVGRCADHVLRKRDDCLNLFLHAPEEARAKAVAEHDGIDLEQARQQVRERDHLRRSYYNYYTGKNWGDVGSYHMTIDTSLFGREGTVDLLEGLALRADEVVAPRARSMD